MKRMQLLLALLVCGAQSASAENLHQKYGPSWSCNMISSTEVALIAACKVCEQRGEQFNKKSEMGGSCESSELTNLKSEMEALERQQKERELGKLNDEMRQLESQFRRSKAASESSNEPDPNAVVFQLRNMHKNSVQASFFSQDRKIAWPGDDKAYTLNDSELHTYRLRCQKGERICYGAWLTGNKNSHWGVGFDGDEACKGCCVFCGSSSVHVYNLFPSRDGGSSNPAGVVEYLGAAIGVAAAIAGASSGGGGGGSSYRGTPSVPAGSFRDRPSGVSGGR